MTLLELCSPIFAYVCELNRAAAVKRVPSAAAIRERFRELLRKAASTADAQRDGALSRRWKKMEEPLVFFIDGMARMVDGGHVGHDWILLAKDAPYNNEAGDDDFIDKHLDPLLNSSDEDSRELLMVFYVCLGLGYRARYLDDPDQLARRIKKIRDLLHGVVDDQPEEYLCKSKENDAYFVSTDSLPPPRAERVVFWVAMFVLVILMIVGAYTIVYVKGTSDVRNTLEAIVKPDAALNKQP